MESNSSSLLTLLQLTDSGFPTGGYSHSLGLESAIKHSLIAGPENLWNFTLCSLENAGSFALPFVQEAHKGSSSPEVLADIDQLLQVSLVNHVANRASSRQGRALLDSAVFSLNVVGLQQLSSALIYSHHAVVFGAVCGQCGLSLDSTLVAYLYSILRIALASAIRLDKVGPLQAQRLQTGLQQLIPSIISRCRDHPVTEAAVTFLLPDVMQNAHDKQFSRLFYS